MVINREIPLSVMWMCHTAGPKHLNINITKCISGRMQSSSLKILMSKFLEDHQEIANLEMYIVSKSTSLNNSQQIIVCLF